MTLRLRPGVTIHESGDQAILLGTGRDAAYWRLNGTAKQMVTLLLDGRDVETVVTATTAVVAADAAVVRRDVENLVTALLDAKLAEDAG
ncbi:PqqD family peptide modification chaperone [Actinokineospora pegani]|uniref:PqqD family peptide modification chaperone n=1 Tax=Actinokineospora pegani TaxID=2654637 RepID=UPI0012E9C797|nr:PqqD family peptide modification chaperone [Actinokineospora pegani]